MPPTQSTDTTAWPWSAEERDRGPPHTPRYFLTTSATKRVNNNTLEDCVRSKCCKVSLQQGKITEYFKAQLKPQKKCDTKIQISNCEVTHKKLAVHISGTVVPVATKLPLVFQQQKTTLKSELANMVTDNSVVTKVNRVTAPPLLLRKSLNSSHELSPVPVTPVFRKPTSVLKCSSLPCAPEVSVLVPKPKTPSVDSAQHTACSTPNPPSPSNTTTSPLSVSTSEHCSDKPSLPSPILRTPSVIRFPARNGWKGHFLSDIVCRWSECEEYFSTTSALLEHLQAKHVNTQSLSETFVCLWNGCKVYDRASCSRSWLERHVLSHGGNKPFRCIVDGCGQRFSSQIMLERHVNQHFNQTENSNSSGTSSKRNLESTPNKLFRRNGKKLRYRRQPFSARMFDYIDTGIMEGVQHSLLTVAKRQALGQLDSCSSKSLTLHSKIIGRRTAEDGTTNVLLRWFPLNIMNDEWVPQAEVRQTQQVPWKQCQDLYHPPLFRQRSTHHQRKQSATR
uniref:C2H2-type domain-containing protein n=2 Tax=Cuerna arida TaxID=1464854 RepID=A0A1B6GXZ9_9HEMI